MKKAELYQKLEGGKVKCTACAHYCTILPGMSGICGVRQNIDGELYLLVYGKAAAVNVDPIEKKPLFHFLPGTPVLSIGTIGCSYGCSFCQNSDISQYARELKVQLLREKKLNLMQAEITDQGYDLPPEKIVEYCLEHNIPSIAFTYNEPSILFEYIRDTAVLAKRHGMKIVMVSNGYESAESMEEYRKFLDAVNIDLKAFNDKFYVDVCRAHLQPVLDTISGVHDSGIWQEITTLLIPGHNDSNDEIQGAAEFIASVNPKIPWHVTAFHPDYKMTDVDYTPFATLKRAYKIGKAAGLKYVYAGNIPNADYESTFCPECNEVLIKRFGYNTQIERLDGRRCGNCCCEIPGIWDILDAATKPMNKIGKMKIKIGVED